MNREINPPEFDAPMEAMPTVLEQAVTEIRDESVDPAVIEAAARRVWAKLTDAKLTEAGQNHNITGCSAFQALIPDYRAGRLSEARALLLKDHLNECVACRKVFEGRVLTMPVQGLGTQRRYSQTFRWAAAAVVVAARSEEHTSE